MNNAILELRDISFDYGGKNILKDINLIVNEGSYTALVGINGSGKTTLFNIASGYLLPRCGQVLFKGKPVFLMKINERAKNMAFVFQKQRTDFPFTCLEMVLMGAHPYRGNFGKARKEEINEALFIMEQTGITELCQKPVNEISGGEMQKVIIARALMQKPRLLLMDEAVSELDISSRFSILKLLKRLTIETGLTVFAIHHDLNTAFRFADKVIALKDNKIFTEGIPTDVMTKDFFKTVFSVDIESLSGKGFIINDSI